MGPILFQVSLKIENLSVHGQRTKWYGKDLTWFDLTHPTMLMALTMEEGSHKNIVISQSWEWSSVYSHRENGPLVP